MPGWFTHFDVARKTIERLDTNANAASFFKNPDDATYLQGIARKYPAYLMTGSVGPDMFFLLPDFKRPLGKVVALVADTIREIYPVIDKYLLIPWEDIMGPITENDESLDNALSGGLTSMLDTITDLWKNIHEDALIFVASRQVDLFSFLSSGVQSAYDEQAHTWSDMLHYRQTNAMAARLWDKACAIQDQDTRERFQTFALGWMTHVGTDIAGHCYINQKTGGPYRLHWQRHHLIENHVDAKLYDSQYGTQDCYEMITKSGLHRWITFSDEAKNPFDSDMGEEYSNGSTPYEVGDRDDAFDVKNPLFPDDLAAFIAETLKDVYAPIIADPANTKGQEASNPTILSDIYDREGTTKQSLFDGGFPTADDVAGTYFWMEKYLKMITTDGLKFYKPPVPTLNVENPFPEYPGSQEGDFSNPLLDVIDFFIAVWAWFKWLGQVLKWCVAEIEGKKAAKATLELRQDIYNFIILPLYNMWLSLHWYMSITGYAYPNQSEINEGLHRLGAGFTWELEQLEVALNDPLGALGPDSIIQTPTTEPSSRPDCYESYPRDVVLDPGLALFKIGSLYGLYAAIKNEETPSEFLRPWLWPITDIEGDNVLSEFIRTKASPYKTPQEATILISDLAGDNTTRTQYERAISESDTLALYNKIETSHLGGPIDYSAYIISQLARTGHIARPVNLPNFNLDADRGYGYKCWDWKRSSPAMCAPSAYTMTIPGLVYPKTNPYPANGLGDGPYQRAYRLPVNPGYGWDPMEYLPKPANSIPKPDPRTNVLIRYLDEEEK